MIRYKKESFLLDLGKIGFWEGEKEVNNKWDMRKYIGSA